MAILTIVPIILLINVYITLGDDGSIKYYIPNSEIEGKAKSIHILGGEPLLNNR